MARTNCRMGPRSIPARQTVRVARGAVLHLRLPLKVRRKRGARQRAVLEDLRDESVTAVYSAAGRHHPLDGRRPSCWLGGFKEITHHGDDTGRLHEETKENE